MNEIKKNPYIWLISGCSSGFGREIALQALSAGDFVGVSSRNLKDVEQSVYLYIYLIGSLFLHGLYSPIFLISATLSIGLNISSTEK